MTPDDYLSAARCPVTVRPQSFGLWEIKRITPCISGWAKHVGWDSYTTLWRWTEATMHVEPGEVVMDDTIVELRQHLPIWLRGQGRVLITGLGLGCVVRGLLASPRVERIDVIEIDRGILDVIGPEFEPDDRVNLIHGDALAHPINGERWDCAWHDIWVDEGAVGKHLQLFHMELIARFRQAVDGPQGAWKMPRWVARLEPGIAGLR